MHKHFPQATNLGDVTKIEHAPNVDVIAGGFPCQDISLAGKGAGIGGERSGLWKHYARLINEIKPKYAVIENVSALRSRGLDVVLRDLDAIGYDAEWHCIPASYVGAPHRRDRVWIVAYPSTSGLPDRRRSSLAEPLSFEEPERQGSTRSGLQDVANADEPRLEGWLGSILRERASEQPVGSGSPLPDTGLADANSESVGRTSKPRRECDWWLVEPDVGRVANGVPKRVDRLRCLGNSIVPQVAELIFSAINAREAA